MENQIRELYIQGLSGVKIAEQLSVPPWKVYSTLKKEGIARRSNKINSRKYDINHRFFENVDEEHKAYWLGFIFADGHVTKKHKVAVSCKVDDREHLEKLKIDMESNYPIKTYEADTAYGRVKYSRFLVTSELMVNDLISFGCVYNKSLILDKPVNLSKHLTRHFIRGYIDGDGCITEHNKGIPKLSAVGTGDFLTWVKEQMPSPALVEPEARKPYIYNLRSVGRHAVENIRWLYEDADIYLERKYARAMDTLG